LQTTFREKLEWLEQAEAVAMQFSADRREPAEPQNRSES